LRHAVNHTLNESSVRLRTVWID
jgi:hypothetical protein